MSVYQTLLSATSTVPKLRAISTKMRLITN
jgi:hypothetical protein